MRIANFVRAALAATLSHAVSAQTFTDCNPLTTTCPADAALGMSIRVDFTKGGVNSFVASGKPTYDGDGVSFSVASRGDAPQLISTFYIMFGRVEITMKSAPGTGIVSSAVLQSDTLDEIDFEWLGIDDAQVQTNYFGKGIVGSYNRGQFNPAPNNQADWHTYIIDWTQDRIVWLVDGAEVRTLTADSAEDNQYPQSPMQFKFGAWAGGDPGNSQGTIEWAGGVTNYENGPYSMKVKSIAVSDYSTGKEYRYKDNSGSWQSIEAVDGEVNGNVGNVDVITITASAASPTDSGSPRVPAGGMGTASGDATLTQTGWPWVPGATPDQGSVPDGWVMTGEGKLIPNESVSVRPPLVVFLSSLLLGVFIFIGHSS